MEEQMPPNHPVAGSNPVSPASLCQEDILSGHGIAAGALDFQSRDAGSTPAVRSKSCNRHNDCEAAEIALLGRKPGMKKTDISLSFHCHDDECEDCFGK